MKWNRPTRLLPHNYPMTLSRVEQAHDATQALTDEEFKKFRTWIALDEANRRERESAARAGQNVVYRQMREAGVLPTPDPEDEWNHPDGVNPVYLHGDQITHDGQLWQSVADGANTEEPGTGDGWMNITPPPEDVAVEDPSE